MCLALWNLILCVYTGANMLLDFQQKNSMHLLICYGMGKTSYFLICPCELNKGTNINVGSRALDTSAHLLSLLI
jgi:hypothetical protein